MNTEQSIDYYEQVTTTRIIQWFNYYCFSFTQPDTVVTIHSKTESIKIQFTLLRKRVFPISLFNRELSDV